MQHMPVQARGWAPPQRLVTTGLAEGAVPSGHASATRVSRRGAAAASFAAMVFAGSPLAAHATSVFTGVYDDPNHPGCPRTIDESGKIVGVDPVPFKRGSGCGQDTKLSPPWSIQGKVDEKKGTIFIDFDQKDGSGEAFLGKWTGKGIKLPDGTVWTKK